MTANRVMKELSERRSDRDPPLHNIEDKVLLWTGLIYPKYPPYNKAAYKIQIKFPENYPLEPFKITFITKIYHPNVSEQGELCLHEDWNPATKAEHAVQFLLALLHEPELDQPLRPDIAEEFRTNEEMYIKKAEEYTIRHGEPRS